MGQDPKYQYYPQYRKDTLTHLAVAQGLGNDPPIHNKTPLRGFPSHRVRSESDTRAALPDAESKLTYSILSLGFLGWANLWTLVKPPPAFSSIVMAPALAACTFTSFLALSSPPTTSLTGANGLLTNPASKSARLSIVDFLTSSS